MARKKMTAKLKLIFLAAAIFILSLFLISNGHSAYVLITIDVEQDIPPYFDTYRGVEEGVPVILDILDKSNVKGTFFVTGDSALENPESIMEIYQRGHEIGSHGFFHENFTEMNYTQKQESINRVVLLLREYNVRTFRAPYQSTDSELVDVLGEFGFCADASHVPGVQTGPTVTSSGKEILRITSDPLFFPSTSYPDSWEDFYEYAESSQEDTVLGKKIIVIGLHSWEVLDLENGPEEYIRSSGDYTRDNLESLIRHLKSKNVKFVTASELCETFSASKT